MDGYIHRNAPVDSNAAQQPRVGVARPDESDICVAYMKRYAKIEEEVRPSSLEVLDASEGSLRSSLSFDTRRRSLTEGSSEGKASWSSRFAKAMKFGSTSKVVTNDRNPMGTPDSSAVLSRSRTEGSVERDMRGVGEERGQSLLDDLNA